MIEKIQLRLGRATAEILDELVDRGYFRTRSEALRAGILRLGESYGLIPPASQYWKELMKSMKMRDKKLDHAGIVEALKRLEDEG